jgi:hypothetical protein
MWTALDVPETALDDGERNFIGNIRKHGWAWHSVMAGTGPHEPSFAYTTGIWHRTGSPELMIFSTKKDIVSDVFWGIFRDIERGEKPIIGQRTRSVFSDLDAVLLPVARRHYEEHLGWSRWFYGDDAFPCLQIYWADRQNRMPWEAGFADEFKNQQPDLSEEGWPAA